MSFYEEGIMFLLRLCHKVTERNRTLFVNLVDRRKQGNVYLNIIMNNIILFSSNKSWSTPTERELTRIIFFFSKVKETERSEYDFIEYFFLFNFTLNIKTSKGEIFYHDV
jgi:hypothetical protein